MNKKQLLLLLVLGAFSISIKAQSPVWVQKAHPEGLQVNGVIFTGDGQSVITGTNCHPAKIRRFNTSDGAMTWDYTVSLSLECMMGVALSSNNQYFASAEETGHLMLFDYTLDQPALVQTIDLGTSYAFSVDFAPNSSQVVIGCSTGKLKAFNLPAGTEAWSITAHTNWVTALDYASDNSKIATGGSDNKVKIWSNTGTLLQTLNGHTDDITSVKFTPDNQKLLSTSRDKKMRVWDVNSGALLQTITISSQVVNALDISPDGQYAVTAADTSLRIWRLSDYSPVGSFSTGDLDEPIAVSWSPTANFIVCGTSNAGVALFDVSTTVGIEELPNLTAQVYPNPCPGVLNVTWPSSEPIERAELYDLNGRLLLTCNHLDHENTLQIDLKAQNSVLMLRLTAQDGRSTTRMIYKQ